MTSVSAAAAVTASTSTSTLVKMANGEYTATSVTADPSGAAKLGLTKQKDGNYGTASVASTTSTAANTSASNTLAAVTSLTLGGV